MQLLVFFTLLLSSVAFNPANDIEIKYGGYCSHFLTFEECSNPATLTAVLANTNLKKYVIDSSSDTKELDEKIHHVGIQIDSSTSSYTHSEGQHPFSIHESSFERAPGCFLVLEDSGSSKHYWSLHWRRMLSPFELSAYDARKSYVISKIPDTNKRIYDAYACLESSPCICRSTGGLSKPDRELDGSYYMDYETATIPYQGSYSGSKASSSRYRAGTMVEYNGNFFQLKEGNAKYQSTLPGSQAFGYGSSSEIWSERLVNNVTADTQYPKIALSFSDGQFVPIWNSAGSRPMYQFYNSDGTKVGSVTTADITILDADSFSNGKFIVASYVSSSKLGVQKYDNNGNKEGTITELSTTGMSNILHHRIRVLPNQKYVVVYRASNTNTNRVEIRMRLFNSDGTEIGSDKKVNSDDTQNNQKTEPHVVALPNNNFVVVWKAEQQPSTGNIYMQRYDDSGTALGSETLVNTVSSTKSMWNMHAAACEDGSFIITYDNENDVLFQRFNNDGSKKGSEVTVASSDHFPEVVCLKDNHFSIIYEYGKNIYETRYKPDGSVYGSQTLVNTFVGTGAGQKRETPMVTVDKSDSTKYIILWKSSYQISASSYEDVYISKRQLQADDTSVTYVPWLSMKGSDGAVGPQGEQGVQGLAGVNGTDGVDGAQGIRGPTGAAGAAGSAGSAGVNGTNGRDGKDGKDGEDATGSIENLETYLWLLVGGFGVALILSIVAVVIRASRMSAEEIPLLQPTSFRTKRDF